MGKQDIPARKCDNCDAVLIVMLSDAGNANGDLCLECSGATLEDFLEEGVTDEEHMENHVHMMRQFHGQD